MESDKELGYYAKRAKAIQALIYGKGVCTTEDVDRMVRVIEARSLSDGAKVVARAWVNPAFKALQLAGPKDALAQLGDTLPKTTPELAIIENTYAVHNMVVCTLCSCLLRTLIRRQSD